MKTIRRATMAIITIKSPLDVEKYADKALLLNNIPRIPDECLVRAFMRELEYREKRKCKKGDSQGYNGWLYYISKNNRLARVPNNARKRIGDKLIKKKLLFLDEYGLLRAKDEISVKTVGYDGIYVKHRSLIDELSRGNWSDRVIERISEYLDGTLDCTMVIDKAFDVAYEPEYDDDFCLEGDLVTGQSCMSEYPSEAQEFYGGIDDCYVCRFENGKGDQVGRCIMYKYGDIRHFIRIYAKRDYARCALRLLRQEMNEQDLFGRSEYIPDLRLRTNWDTDTPCMYLDGNSYGIAWDDGFYITTNGISDLKHTGCDSLKDVLEEDDCWSCDHCGSWYGDRDNHICVDGYCYCCEDCAESEGYRQCDHCGEWKLEEDMYSTDGNYYCCEDCAESEGYVFCNCCHELIKGDDYIQIDYHKFCSEDCAHVNGYDKCEYCGQWHRSWELKPNFTDDNKKMCSSCATEKHLVEGYGVKKGQENE